MIRVEVKTVKSMEVFCVEGIPPDLGKMMAKLMEWLRSKGAITSSNPVALFHATPDEAPNVEEIRCEACVAAIPPPEPDEQVTWRTLPEVKVAYTTYEGPQSAEKDISLVVEVAKWMKKNGYTQVGPVRQVYHKLWLEDNKAFVEMETQIPVK
jgi:DNA gyrase inhibitor GyrI